MEYLARLESAVRSAGETLAGLRRQNRSLKARIRQLETELAGRPAAAPGSWSDERERVLKRVERLADDLERLLG